MHRFILLPDQIPERLRTIADPPRQLYVASNNWEDLVQRPMVAIVGSRKVTPYGKSITAQLAGELAGQGIVIVSGLAFGVDSIAHRAALEAGGSTIAVLPASLGKVYPRHHQTLANDIYKQGGAVMSEYGPAEITAYPMHFIARNRIIAGLSHATVVTEAAEGSGSLHTTSFALEQGREVMAVPGSITSPMSVGANNLLKSRATMVTTSDDVLFALGLTRQQRAPVTSQNPHEQAILTALKDGAREGNELQRLTAIDIPLFNQALTMLEITGRIKSRGANMWSLPP